MTNDFLFGLVMAIPLYAIILFLVRDIVIERFVAKTIMTKVANNPKITVETEISSDVLKDILTSYRLLLIIKYEFEFLRSRIGLDEATKSVYDEQLKYINETVSEIERLLRDREMGEECLAVKIDVEQMIVGATKEVD